MLNGLRRLFASDAAAAIVLLMATGLALVLANSPFGESVQRLLDTRLGATVGGIGLAKSLDHWIDDGLMVVFFLVVGMEIKREVLAGELSQPSRVVLPIVGALGGVAVPAAIYVCFAWSQPAALKGWAIPSATDIAFAVAIMAALGSRVPSGLRLFLLTLAIVDDLVAILIIAIFYAGNLSLWALALAAVAVAILVALNRLEVRSFAPYFVVGIALWFCVLESGVHATLSGVILAFCLPFGDKARFTTLAHGLRPFVLFLIVPLFAFANSGLDLGHITLVMALHPVTLGIVAGLFIGKQLGIFGAAALLIRLGYARLPPGATWTQLYATAVCGGIGFTMSLFIGTLAFATPDYEAMVRLGVLSASLLSGIVGGLLLRVTSSGQP